MSPPIEIPEVKASRVARSILLGGIGFLVLLVWSGGGVPAWIVLPLGLALVPLCATQRCVFRADRDQGTACLAWTVLGRTVLELRRTQLARFTEVVVSRREQQVQQKSRSYTTSVNDIGTTTRSRFPVHLAGDGDGFAIWTLSTLSDARAVAEQISRALGLRLTDLVAEKLSPQ